MSITIRVMINPLLNSTSEFFRQAHSSLEIRPAFRLKPHCTAIAHTCVMTTAIAYANIVNLYEKPFTVNEI